MTLVGIKDALTGRESGMKIMIMMATMTIHSDGVPGVDVGEEQAIRTATEDSLSFPPFPTADK